jgi:N-acyl amino acid synthase of PEP-CTERM/exosortase system
MSLTSNFLEYFDVAYAATAKQKQDVLQIRYNVYCDEFKYEPAERFPNQEESDEFDARSLHCLITHKSSGLPAGCVRMVQTPDTEQNDALPFQKFCRQSLDRGFIKELALEQRNTCEISRLAVDGAFRRRPGESVTRFGEIDSMDCSHQERRTFSLIAVAAFLSATALTDLTGRTDVFAMMEPFLPRMLRRSGIVFQRAGEDIDYHGVRAPYFIRTQSALDHMRPDLHELYDAINERVTAGYSEAED